MKIGKIPSITVLIESVRFFGYILCYFHSELDFMVLGVSIDKKEVYIQQVIDLSSGQLQAVTFSFSQFLDFYKDINFIGIVPRKNIRTKMKHDETKSATISDVQEKRPSDNTSIQI